MSPRWLHWPAAISGTDYTDYIVSGSSYWVIPDGTAFNAFTSKTGGDASATWTTLGLQTASGTPSIVTSQTGSVTIDSTFYYLIRGGFNQLSNPYQFCARWCDGTTPGGFTRRPHAPGWIVYEAETTSGSYIATGQMFVPIEVQSGTVGGSITGDGYGPEWNDTGLDESLIFFFNSYTPGDVQGWTAWDGLTTP